MERGRAEFEHRSVRDLPGLLPPALFVFNDTRRTILVVNHAYVDGDVFPDRHLVLEAYVGDTALPLAHPVIP